MIPAPQFLAIPTESSEKWNRDKLSPLSPAQITLQICKQSICCYFKSLGFGVVTQQYRDRNKDCQILDTRSKHILYPIGQHQKGLLSPRRHHNQGFNKTRCFVMIEYTIRPMYSMGISPRYGFFHCRVSFLVRSNVASDTMTG